jgi:hypothetical protein
MDREDQEHFRTIASALAAPPKGSPKKRDMETLALDRDPLVALQKAKQIFACYRKDEAHDPEMYAAAVAAVLSGYPAFVTDYVADPRTGIASTSKWLPSVSEIKDACESKLNRIQQDIERDQRIEKQIAARIEDEALKQRERTSYENLKTRYGDGHGGWLGEGTVTTEEEKQAFLESAKQTGAEIAAVTLSAEAKALLDRGSQS